MMARPFTDEIATLFKNLDRTLVIVDDDPTGTQTMHDVPVLGHWSLATFEQEFISKTPLFYVLANSRSLSESQAVKRIQEIGDLLKEAAEKTGRKFLLVSRSDSTLRGHFPVEVEALSRAAGQPDFPVILTPAFFEGGRVTIGDIHYILEGDERIPVSETPFAKDKSFGYTHADLKEWVQEKSKGKIKSSQVKSLSLDVLRSGEEAVRAFLAGLRPKEIMVLNCANYTDMELFCLALLREIKDGKNFLFRTGASFVSAVGGIRPKPWKPTNLPVPHHGGLIVVGSYVPKSTAQLEELLTDTALHAVPLSVKRIVADLQPLEEEIEAIVNRIEESIATGKTVVVYTSRELVSGADAAESLAIGEKVNSFLVDLISKLSIQPSFIVAKGGITSNDLAVKSLGMKRAMVAGQILPGIPVWQLESNNKFPKTPYVVFPGNVGDAFGLKIVNDLFTKALQSP